VTAKSTGSRKMPNQRNTTKDHAQISQ